MIAPGLNGRVVLVTGGNSGIGSGIVRAFAAQRARVAIHYLESAVPVAGPGISVEHAVRGRVAAEEILAEVRASGGEAILVAADLSIPDEIPRLGYRNYKRLISRLPSVSGAAPDPRFIPVAACSGSDSVRFCPAMGNRIAKSDYFFSIGLFQSERRRTAPE